MRPGMDAFAAPPVNESLEQARARNVRDALREDVGTGRLDSEPGRSSTRQPRG